jgi:SAM-dependent methyltransferase
LHCYKRRHADAAGELLSSIDKTFQERKADELAFYAEREQIHDLPPIQEVWSARYLTPKLEAVGLESLDALYLTAIRKAADAAQKGPVRVVSLGAGNCDLELALAARLGAATRREVTFECLELNPAMLERGRERAVAEGLDHRFAFVEADLNTWRPEQSYEICLANHSLHHVVELEHLFDAVAEAIRPDGAFLVNDMIGRNGHMRWPEALSILEPVWRAMPDRYKHNRQLGRFEPEFVNWDCSAEGFEGIRAQDILPLLLERFTFETFVAFANIVSPFIDRSFGPNFDIDREEDVDFVLRVAELDELAIDLGIVKPTQMIAVLRKEASRTPHVYRHWTPEFCVRWPDPHPPPGDARARVRKQVVRAGARFRRIGLLRMIVRRVPGAGMLWRRLEGTSEPADPGGHRL